MSRWDVVLPRALAACGGFLLAVLWMDLMFDVQILAGDPSASALGSIRAYYRRVTLDAGAMSYLVGGTMIVAVAGAIIQARRSRAAISLRVAVVALIAVPVALAGAMILPEARELAQSVDPERQLELARRVCYTHMAVFAAVSTFVAIQLATRRPRAAA